MKWLLVAIYLAHGSINPEIRTKEFTDKGDCQSMAAAYVKQVHVGQSRAFCLPIKSTY